jgi:hypothetical protein
MRTKKSNHSYLILTIILIGSVLHQHQNAAQELEFADVLKKAVQHYEAGKLSDAERQLQLAQQILRDQRALNLKACLPTGLPGWSIENSDSQANELPILGVQISANRSFTKGTSKVQTSISADTPLLQQFAALLNSPLMNLREGSRLEQINGEVARVTYDPNERSGELMMIVSDRYLITVKGSDTSREDIIAFAKAFDFETLGKTK